MTPVHAGRRRRLRSRLPVVAAALAVAIVAAAVPVRSSARADTVTGAADELRTSWFGNQPALTPAVVGSANFGQLFSTAITGQVYAQPLVANNVLLVATETNDVYGIDPVSGVVEWHRNFGTPFNALTLGCGDLSPSVGITGTPVVDPATGTAFFFAKTYVSGTSGPGQYVAHAVDVTTGTERPGWPVIVAGMPANAPGEAFNATYELQRPGLLLMNGVVYAAFGGHCDVPPYRGYVVGLTTGGAMTTMWASEQAFTSGAGIWMAGSPLMSDGPGQILFATGNGAAPPIGGGLNATPNTGLGESTVRLSVQPDGSLRAVDSFTPYDADTLNTNDQDFGSGGVTGLPDSFGTASHPHVLVVAGKQGYVYLLDRDHLGGRSSSADNVVGKFGPFGGVWSKPAVWPGDGGYVYLPSASAGAQANGVAGYLRVYQRVVDGSGNPALSLVASSPDVYGFGSSAPVVTSNGTQSGSALVWIIHTFDGSGQFGELRAYDAVPNGGALTLRFHAPIGTANKFTPPAVDNGRVYVGTRDGHVLAFGVVGAGPPLTGPSLDFPGTAVGASSQSSVTLTASRATTVTAASVDNPAFTAGASTPSLPATLAAGQSISVPVTFAPNRLGAAAGTLSVTTDSGVAAIPLAGTGIAPTLPLATSPISVDFGTLPGGSHTVSASIVFTNTGSTTQTVQSVTPPAAPFGLVGAPAIGTTIAPGASVAATVTFTPPDQSGTSTTPYADSVAVTTDQTTAAVPIAAMTSLPSDAVIPAAVSFGNVQVHQTVTLSFDIGNDGGSPMTILKSKPPVVNGFAAASSLAEGTVLQPGQRLTESVTFTPGTTGAASAAWIITTDDGSGVHQVGFTGTGVTYPTLPPPGAGWQLNGSATMRASTLELTSATTNEAGSAFLTTPVSSANLDATFTATLGGGSGADGLTFALIDPADAPTALGTIGSGLGFAGLHGLAATIDTFPNGAVAASDFVGVAQTTVADPTTLTFVAHNTDMPDLRSAPRHVHVTVSGGVLTMSIDGVPAVRTPVTLPPNVLVGFTAATGGVTDAHTVSAVNLATYAPPAPKAISAPPTGWKLNGQARVVNGAALQLTAATTNTSGSAWYTSPVAADGLDVSFRSAMTGGTGGAGTALVFAAPTTSTTYLGKVGGAYGFAGVAATAVVLNGGSGVPSKNFVGIATSAVGSAVPAWVTTSSNIASLRARSHVVHVTVSGATMTVAVDGTRVLQATVRLPSTVRLGFTGATGTTTDVHTVSSVAITSGQPGQAPPGKPSATAAPPKSWQFNGTATTDAPGSLLLTPASGYGAGSAFALHPLATASPLRISFRATIGGGTGGDGLCLVLADASLSGPSALGSPGGGLGYSGIPGVCVGLRTFQGPGDPGSNFIGIGAAGSFGAVTWTAANTSVMPLRTTSHDIVVTVQSGTVAVTMDGLPVLSTAVAIPAQVLVGFTAANGAFNDRHAVSDVNVTTS